MSSLIPSGFGKQALGAEREREKEREKLIGVREIGKERESESERETDRNERAIMTFTLAGVITRTLIITVSYSYLFKVKQK